MAGEVRLDRQIGEGSFGKVYAGTCRGAKVAIKVPLKQLSREELQDLRQEVVVLSSVFHPNVVLFMGACTREEEQLMIVTELKDCTVESMLKAERERRKKAMESRGSSSRGGGTSGGMNQGEGGGNMGSPNAKGQGQQTYFLNAEKNGVNSNNNIISSPGSSSSGAGNVNMPSLSNPMVRMRMARDTALGTNWLHNISHIIHRDLKTANLLFDAASGRVCVTDFGLSEALSPQGKAQDRFGPRGSALFMAPEVIRQLSFDHLIDTYSFGIILWELWTCDEPFAEFYDFDTFVDAVHVRGMRPPISSQHYGSPSCTDLTKTCPPKLATLIKACWHDSPSKRPPDFEAILHSLNEIIIDLALSAVSSSWGGVVGLPPEGAASFWFVSFCSSDLVERVPWSSFLSALDAHTGWSNKKIDGKASSELMALQEALNSFSSSSSSSSFSSVSIQDISFDLLAPYLIPLDDGHVTLAQYAECIEWFGDFTSPSSSLPSLFHLLLLSRSPWFFGNISRQAAEAHLNSKATCPHSESFLIRLSASFPGSPFTLSRPSYSTRRPNLRIRRSPSPSAPLGCTYAVEFGPSDLSSPSFASLPLLISSLSSELRLLHPAPPIIPYEGGY